MVRRIWNWLAARLGRSNEDNDEEEGSDSRFVPSELDQSVRAAHGGATVHGKQEIANIQEEAEELERHRRDS